MHRDKAVCSFQQSPSRCSPSFHSQQDKHRLMLLSRLTHSLFLRQSVSCLGCVLCSLYLVHTPYCTLYCQSVAPCSVHWGQYAAAGCVDQVFGLRGGELCAVNLLTLKSCSDSALFPAINSRGCCLWVIALVCSVTAYAGMAHIASVPPGLKLFTSSTAHDTPDSLMCNLAEKGMSKLKQRLGLKKQGSKTLTATESSPSPSNLYPMAAGGHHPGNPHVQATPDPGQRSSPHDPPYPGSGDLQQGHLGMAGQGSGRQRSAGNEEAEEQAMIELAIKVRLPIVVCIMHCRLQH